MSIHRTQSGELKPTPAGQPADKRPGLVLSGGGARGAFQVGVWRHLKDDPIYKDRPLVLSGTSAGAINSAFIAAGKTPDEMMQFWLDLTHDPPVQVSQRFVKSALQTLAGLVIKEPVSWLKRGAEEWDQLSKRMKHHFPFKWASPAAVLVEHLLASRWDLVSSLLEGIEEPYLADISRMRDRLVKAFGGSTVPTGDNRLAINTVDVETGQVVRFVNYVPPGETLNAHYQPVREITVDMVMASAAIPLLFNPVKVGNRTLWDGGLLVNTPLAPAVAMGADEIVSVLVTKGPQPGISLHNFGESVERVADAFLENSYNLDRMLLLERNILADLPNMVKEFRRVKLYKEIRPEQTQEFSAGSYLFFNRGILREMHDQGMKAVLDWQAEGPLEDALKAG